MDLAFRFQVEENDPDKPDKLLPCARPNPYGRLVAVFAEFPTGGQFPPRYHDARAGLRLRVVDRTENQVPDWVVSVEIGDSLSALVTWGPLLVPVELAQQWMVSTDELVTAATDQVVSLPVERRVHMRNAASVEVTLGHVWASSLITRVGRNAETAEGVIIGIPRCDVMMTAKVDESAIDALELIMLACDELYDPADAGVSPHVWWYYQDKLWRLTDRRSDGTIDIEHHANVAAFHLVGAIEHLMNPCEECGRSVGTTAESNRPQRGR